MACRKRSITGLPERRRRRHAVAEAVAPAHAQRARRAVRPVPLAGDLGLHAGPRLALHLVRGVEDVGDRLAGDACGLGDRGQRRVAPVWNVQTPWPQDLNDKPRSRDDASRGTAVPARAGRLRTRPDVRAVVDDGQLRGHGATGCSTPTSATSPSSSSTVDGVEPAPVGHRLLDGGARRFVGAVTQHGRSDRRSDGAHRADAAGDSRRVRRRDRRGQRQPRRASPSWSRVRAASDLALGRRASSSGDDTPLVAAGAGCPELRRQPGGTTTIHAAAERRRSDDGDRRRAASSCAGLTTIASRRRAALRGRRRRRRVPAASSSPRADRSWSVRVDRPPIRRSPRSSIARSTTSVGCCSTTSFGDGVFAAAGSALVHDVVRSRLVVDGALRPPRRRATRRRHLAHARPAPSGRRTT